MVNVGNIIIFLITNFQFHPFNYRKGVGRVECDNGARQKFFSVSVVFLLIQLVFQLIRFIGSSKVFFDNILVDIIWILGYFLVAICLHVTYFQRTELAMFLTGFLHMEKFNRGEQYTKLRIYF